MPKATVTKTGKSLNPVQKRQAIKVRLRRGDISEIAARTGYDQSHVSRVIRGIRQNDAILNAAYTRVSKRKVTA